MANKNSTVFIEDYRQIHNFIQSRSPSMTDYLENSKASFTLWHKTLLHSDLTGRGKRNGLEQGFEKNFLYYLSIPEMIKVQTQFPDKPFESAKQSNIGLPMAFYSDLGVPRLERREGKQDSLHDHISLNDYVDVYLVNDTLDYFTKEYTCKVLKTLNKYDDKFSRMDDVE